MKLKKRKPLGLEALEDRWVPATVRFDGSNLIVSNPLITAGASTLTVIQQANGSFKVTDGVANNGTYAVTGNITVLGNNAKDNFTVNVLAGSGLAGNLSVNGGNGNNTVTVDSTAAIGFIAGNTSIALGNGTNTVEFGTAVGLTEKGSLYASSRGPGDSRVRVLGGAAASSVLGSTTLSGFPTVILGLGLPAPDVFAGDVNINSTSNPQRLFIVQETKTTVLGNLTAQNGQGGSDVTLFGSVLGTVALNLGDGTNFVGLSAAFGGVNFGNLVYNGGNGSNHFATFGDLGTVTVLGNAVLNWGNGANALNFLGIGTAALTVDGNMSITNGNGGLDGATLPFEAVVNGNLNVNAGNGNNSFTLDGAGTANVLGSFNYTGGNGGNSITVTTQASDFFTLNVRMGDNPGTGSAATSNVFQIGTGPGAGFVNGTLTGLVSWGIPSSAANGNAFSDDGYVWMNAITLINVPS